MKRKVRLGVVFLLCFMALAIRALAKEDEDVYLSLQIDNPMMTVNGELVEVDEGRGTTPLIVEGRTLLPVRAVIEAFGGEVVWDGQKSAVLITIGEDTAELIIGSGEAFFNGEVHALDVPPSIINDRTMLPIRFIAESFSLGIAWNGDTKTVHVIRDVLTEEEYERVFEFVPDYNGDAFVIINENVPFFNEFELIDASIEYYGPLDDLNRCNVTLASLDEDLMPTEERESISAVIPSGWINVKYDFISGKYLYNRCHLIGYQLTGENANDRNLITGTRYLNIEGMLEFENRIAEYVRESDNRVMYRVTPVFSGDNLVAHGVLLEALEIEQPDAFESAPSEGETSEKFSMCVFCYNIQPGVMIDYKTGESKVAEDGEDIFLLELFTATESDGEDKGDTEDVDFVFRTPSGKKYHLSKECGGKNSYETTIGEAVSKGLTPCSKCAA